MEPTLGLLDTGEKGSKMEKDYNMGMCSEDETELELGLGLSLNSGGGGGGGGVGAKTKKSPWGEYGRILTAKDFPNGFSAKRSINGGVSGTKRAADFAGSTTEVGSPPTGSSQVVGWPPIRAYRMNSLVNQSKVLNTDEDKGVGGNDKKEHSKKKINHGNSKDDAASVKEKGHLGFVKVNMDGLPIGRKVDLNAHTCYESLAETLEDMFFKSTKSGEKEQATKSFKLLDGSSEFVLTYEDKEGDWMLVGDVPFGMFLNTVKRLRIMRTSEANGLDPPKVVHFGGSYTSAETFLESPSNIGLLQFCFLGSNTSYWSISAPRIPQKQERHKGKPI